MSKAKSRKDLSPEKKPRPLTKKKRKERKKKRKKTCLTVNDNADTVFSG